VLLGGVFAGERAGEVSLTKPKRKAWIAAKMLSSALTGGVAVLALSLGMLAVYGLCYGLQGWSLTAVTMMGTQGNVFALYTDIPVWGMALLKCFFLTLGGAFFGCLTACFSALFHRALPAVGASIASVVGMEALFYLHSVLFGGILTGWREAFYYRWADPDLLEAFCLTPARLFFHADILLIRMGAFSGYSPEITFNVFSTPDMAVFFAALLLTGTALCAAVPFFIWKRTAK